MGVGIGATVGVGLGCGCTTGVGETEDVGGLIGWVEAGICVGCDVRAAFKVPVAATCWRILLVSGIAGVGLEGFVTG